MRIDFYQLDDEAAGTGVLAAVAGKLLEAGERLLVTSSDEAQLARLDRALWTLSPDTFLAHDLEGGQRDTDQPILLSTRTVAPNGARNIALADGEWRPAALGFERAFMLFDGETIEAARTAWKDLSDTPDIERHYWAREDGKWVQRA